MPLLSGRRLERAQASPHFRDGVFHNPSGAGPTLQGSSLSVMADFFLGGRKRRPHGALPVESPVASWSRPASSGFRVTWLGHSTLLLESDGVRILTDPMFGPRASPVTFAGPKRFHPVPATIAELPPLDVVLLSHDHHDHFDPASLRELARLRVPIITSLGVGARLEALGFAADAITELDWWESATLAGGRLTLSATPAQHFSGRGLRDRNRTLWSSWVIETERRRLFFSGDTGMTDDLHAIRERFGSFDLSMIEIGAWHPAWNDIHLGPTQALQAFERLGGGTLLPIHWGTFDLALHVWDEPAETLTRLAEASGARVLTPRLGQAIEPLQIEATPRWWRAIRRREEGAT